MAASTVTALPYQQWRIMNSTRARSGEPATPLLHRCGADVDDLIALADRGLIKGLLGNDDIDLGLLVHDRGLLNDFGIRIAHTPAGATWVANNPSNRALITIESVAGRRPAKMTKVAEDAHVDAGLFLLLEHTGLVKFSLANGHDIRPVGTTTLAFYRNSLHVQLTAKGFDILG
jgi:hypothetical protein